jgi:ABC-type branched-subunit amino acid transport system ATPase component
MSAPASDTRTTDTVIDVAGLTKRFGGTTALDAVTFQVRRGRVTGIIGPNGSGKTTTLKCLSGFLRPDGGSISVDGTVTTHESPRRLFELGIVQTFQRVALAEDMTVAENVLLGGDGRRIARPRRVLADLLGLDRGMHGSDPAEVVSVLAETGLEAYTDDLVGTLPLGIRRRVELARALLARPRFLLLDEPASGLDAKESAELVQVVADVRAGDPSLTLVVVEHDLEVIAGVCDDLVVLDFGHLIAAGGVEATFADERVRAAYLGTVDV